MTRRSFLAAPAAITASPRAGYVLAPGSLGHVTLRRSGEPGALVLPSLRARIAASLSLDGNDIVATVFGADPDGDTTVDLLGLTAHAPATPPRLCGLELVAYADADGVLLSTRFAMTADGARLAFARAAAASRSATLVARASWIDYLAWDGAAPLADRPVHPPPEFSIAAILAARRARVRVALSGDVAEVTPALLRDCGLLGRLKFAFGSSP